jgi:uncharacterized membrane protein
MQNHLPPLMERYGEALTVVAVNVDTQQGQVLYGAVARQLRLPGDRQGVPALLVGDVLLVGSGEIPARFPGIVEDGLADGGIDWPPIPQLRSYLALQGIVEDASVQLEPWMLGTGEGSGAGPAVVVLGREPPSSTESVQGRFMQDPIGNSVAVAVLVAMVLVLAYSVRRVVRPRGPMREWPAWAVPTLAAVGIGIAGYLAFVETSGAQAVCGPVGDCNRVQQSPWASIAGVPIGVLGLGGYLALGALALARGARPEVEERLSLLLWGLAATGMAFSIYLTFLEPFVIGATCLWCINSALVMTLILLLTTPAAARARRARAAAR